METTQMQFLVLPRVYLSALTSVQQLQQQLALELQDSP